MSEHMTTYEELTNYGINEINDASKLLLSTVEIVDNRVDCWITCVIDSGEIKLIPNDIKWQDERKEINVWQNGEMDKIFIKDGYPMIDHMSDKALVTLWKIPTPILKWVINKCK